MPVEEIDLSNIEKYLDLNDVPESDFEPIKFKRGRPNYFLSIHLKSKNLQDIVCAWFYGFVKYFIDLHSNRWKTSNWTWKRRIWIFQIHSLMRGQSISHYACCVFRMKRVWIVHCIHSIFHECFIVFRYECNTQLQTIVNSVLGDHNLVLTFENLSLIEDRVIYVDIRDDDEKYGTNKMFLVGIERNYINWDPQSSIIFKRSDWVFSFDSSVIAVVSPRDSLDWTIHTTIGKVSRASYRYNSYKELKEHKHVYRW